MTHKHVRACFYYAVVLHVLWTLPLAVGWLHQHTSPGIAYVFVMTSPPWGLCKAVKSRESHHSYTDSPTDHIDLASICDLLLLLLLLLLQKPSSANSSTYRSSAMAELQNLQTIEKMCEQLRRSHQQQNYGGQSSSSSSSSGGEYFSITIQIRLRSNY